MRIGLGIDVHAFAAEQNRRQLVLGGVAIEHPYGLQGHSDADVLVHAVMDALLSAARLGDIGQHFPDTDSQYKDISSLELLREVAALLATANYQVEDVDCVIIAEEPRLSPYREAMSANIATALGIDKQNIGIKATTSEHLGFEGRQEGISAYAVALLKPNPEQKIV
jgi:2-C-methyl-D-erythritol 2,4-cyclodiphosphate synthase